MSRWSYGNVLRRRSAISSSNRPQYVALVPDPPALLHRPDRSCHLGRIKVLVLVLRHGGVEVREERRDREVVGGLVGCCEEVLDGGEYKLFPVGERGGK